MIKKKSPASKRGNPKDELNDTTLPAQRQRLLRWLRNKPITTIQCRSELNILSPAARIWELRHDYDLNIFTYWDNDITPEGKKHSVAKYVLRPGSFSKNKRGGQNG